MGFINHHGTTLKGGHYTADVKNHRDQAEEERWIHCDDEKLQIIQTPDGESAYLVVLKMIEEEKTVSSDE